LGAQMIQSMTNSVSHIAQRVSDELIAFLVTLIAMLPISPLNMPFVRRDAGVFLYIGSRILDGYVPYKDIWDNKPPVIFYINALGLAISGDSKWGGWLIEFILLFLGALVSLKLIKSIFGTWPAVLSLCLWLLSFITIISGGNYATEYTIPLQFACLLLAYDSERRGTYSWRGYLIGLLSGIAFLTKQNTVGIGFAVVIYLLLGMLKARQREKAWPDLLLIFLGGMTPIVLMVSYLSIQGVFHQFWDAAFVYNFVRSSSDLISHIKSVVIGLIYLSTLTLLAFIGWIVNLLLKLGKLHINEPIERGAASFLSIGLIDLPIELLMSSFTGYSYRHYYLSLLPIYSVFAGFTFWMLITQISYSDLFRKQKRLLSICMTAIFIVPIAGAIVATIRDSNYPSTRGVDYEGIVSYVESNTSEDDLVLIWGAETAINYSSRRLSPSRFVYQYPLYETGYTNEKIIEEFLEDIVKNEPRLIIDTKNSKTPLYAFGISSPRIENAIAFLRSNYQVKEQFGPWTVYEYMKR